MLAATGGCGLGEGREQSGAGVELRVTRDFGQKTLHRASEPRVRQGQTAMRLLQAHRRVETRYGGRFVQAIDGLEGQGAGGRHDWLYFVNGIEASVGAAERALHPGDVVQWDYRRWDKALSVPAIVGAFPEPLVHGSGGKRIPVRLECERDGAPACGEARRRLTAAGVTVSQGELGSAVGGETLRVVVARWAVARTVKAAEPIERGPERSGVFARFAGGGRRLELLDASARVARTAPAGSGLVAATGTHGQPPVWVVTGVDEPGVESAARLLDRRALRDAYAVAALPAGPERLPLGGGR